MTVTYLANAGIVIENRTEEIGIDVFPADPEGVYPDVSAAQFDMVQQKIADGVLSLLLFTHEHADHFNPDMAVKSVQTAQKYGSPLMIVSNRRVIDLLRKAKVPESRLFCAEDAGNGEKEIVFSTRPDLRIIAEAVPHDGARYRDTVNLMYMIFLEGQRLVFTGDAKPERALFEKISRHMPVPDWMFVPFPLYGKPSVRKMILAYAKPVRAALLHFPELLKDENGWILSTKRVCEQAADGLPAPVYLQTPGETVLL